MFDAYAYLVCIFNKIKKAFTDKKMKPIWEKLHAFSAEYAAKFASELLHRIENDYDHALTLIEKHKSEVVSVERIITHAKKLYEELELNAYWFYGHTLQDNHDDFMKELNTFIQNTQDSLGEFTDHIKNDLYLFNGLYPLSRKSRDKNSLPIFYMRRIYLTFNKSFGSPMYAIIAEVVNVIFDTNYNDNDAIKYCVKLRPLLRDDSTKK